MIYPEQFELKIGFERIRELLKGHCLFEPGRERVEEMAFLPDFEAVKAELDLVHEFMQVEEGETDFPVQHFIDNREALEKAAVEGSFLLEEDLSALVKSLDSVRAILRFFKAEEEDSYPSLFALCAPVKVFPFVQDRIARVLNKHGKIKDNASSQLHQIRRSQHEMQGAVSKKLNQVLNRARKEGWVDAEAVPTYRDGRPVIPVMAGNRMKYIIPKMTVAVGIH